MAVSAVGAAMSTGVAAFLTTEAITATFLMNTFAANFAMGVVGKQVMKALAPKPDFKARDNTLTVKSPIASRKVVYGRQRVGGTLVFLDTTGSDNKYLHMVIALASHEVDGLEKVYFDDSVAYESGAVTSKYSGKATVAFYDGTQTTYDTDLESASDSWTENHILNGIAYLYVRLEFDQDVYSGIPNVSAVIRGKKLYDPRNSSTAWSENPALAVYDYLTNDYYGMNVAATEIDVQTFKDAADICDQDVSIVDPDDENATINEDRYKISGVVDTNDAPKDIIKDMLGCMSGYLTYSAGQFQIGAGAYYTPTVTLDEDVMTGPLTVQTKTSRRETFNAVKGVYSSVDDNYVLSDYPPVISSTYSTEDGDPIYADLALPFTTSQTAAQRLAKITLLRSRQNIQVNVSCNLKAMKLKAGDNVKITNTRLGWSEKVFEVRGWKFQLSTDGNLGVQLSLREISSAVFSWSTSEENPYVAGVPTNLPSPTSVNAPTSVSATSGVVLADDGTARPYIDITWTNNDAFAYQFEVRYVVGSDTRTIITTGSEYRLWDVVTGTEHIISVRAINRLGARSAYSSATTTPQADNTAPSAPTNVAATGEFRAIRITWTNPTDADLRRILIYENSSNNSGTATLIAYAAGSEYYRPNLSTGDTKYYWLKAEDFSGNVSSAFSTGVSATTDSVNDSDFADGVRGLFQDAGLDVIEPVDSLPAAGAFDGQQVFLTTDSKLYYWDDTGSSWETVVPDIQDGSIGTDQLAASAVTAGKIAASTITGAKIAANTITGGLLATSGIITNSAQIDDAVITNAKIADLNADKITAGTISADRIAVDGTVLDTNAQGEFTITTGGITTTLMDSEAVSTATSYTSQSCPVTGRMTLNNDSRILISVDHVFDSETKSCLIVFSGNVGMQKYDSGSSTWEYINGSFFLIDGGITSGTVFRSDGGNGPAYCIGGGACATSDSSVGNATFVITNPSGGSSNAVSSTTVTGFLNLDDTARFPDPNKVTGGRRISVVAPEVGNNWAVSGYASKPWGVMTIYEFKR